MALTIEQIQRTASDSDLLELLFSELNSSFPPESRQDSVVFRSRLQTAPKGVWAMISTFELDVSMSMDDLAWHFVNHPDLDINEETLEALRELEAFGGVAIFEKAFTIIKPRWEELGTVTASEGPGAIHDWLDSTGIQALIDPLNTQMWDLLKQWPKLGLMHYWVTYARKYPERCVSTV